MDNFFFSGLLLTLIGFSANAQKFSEGTWDSAYHYSFDNHALAVMVSGGKEVEKYTSQQYAQFLTMMFNDEKYTSHPIEIRSYFKEDVKDGKTVGTFYMNGEIFRTNDSESFAINSIGKNIDLIAEEYAIKMGHFDKWVDKEFRIPNFENGNEKSKVGLLNLFNENYETINETIANIIKSKNDVLIQYSGLNYEKIDFVRAEASKFAEATSHIIIGLVVTPPSSKDDRYRILINENTTSPWQSVNLKDKSSIQFALNTAIKFHLKWLKYKKQLDQFVSNYDFDAIIDQSRNINSELKAIINRNKEILSGSEDKIQEMRQYLNFRDINHSAYDNSEITRLFNEVYDLEKNYMFILSSLSKKGAQFVLDH
jgi:hypothetical protein